MPEARELQGELWKNKTRRNLLAPAQGEHIEAVGQVLRSGRTLTICQLEVFAVQGATRSLVAAGQQTLICLHNRPDHQEH